MLRVRDVGTAPGAETAGEVVQRKSTVRRAAGGNVDRPNSHSSVSSGAAKCSVRSSNNVSGVSLRHSNANGVSLNRITAGSNGNRCDSNRPNSVSNCSKFAGGNSAPNSSRVDRNIPNSAFGRTEG